MRVRGDGILGLGTVFEGDDKDPKVSGIHHSVHKALLLNAGMEDANTVTENDLTEEEWLRLLIQSVENLMHLESLVQSRPSFDELVWVLVETSELK